MMKRGDEVEVLSTSPNYAGRKATVLWSDSMQDSDGTILTLVTVAITAGYTVRLADFKLRKLAEAEKQT